MLIGLFAVTGADVVQAQGSRVSISFGVNVPMGGREFYHGRDRYYAYRGQYYRWDRGGYVRCPPPGGYYIERLPPHYERVIIDGDVYYRSGHRYYRSAGSHYEIVEVPVVVERPIAKPKKSTSAAAPKADDMLAVWLDDQRYLLDKGQYFKPGSKGLVWADTPVGAKLKAMPIGAITIWHEEIEYFEFDGGYFRRAPDGFKVVEVPWNQPEIGKGPGK